MARPPQVVLYDAVVTHRRRAPIVHRFGYRTGYWLIDPDHPPRLRWPLRLLARFDAADHLDIRGFLAEHGRFPDRIVMLAHARSLGYVFNPITVYWCYSSDGSLTAHVAEVHNTYGERHAYLLDPDPPGGSRVAKRLYVSPFYPVDGTYRIRISEPGERVAVTITLHLAEGPPFVATLVGHRRPATAGNLLRMSLRYPWTPLRTSLLIRRQGVRLWRRGLKVVPR